MLRIVHLSDIHLSKTLLFDAENFTIKALLKSLKEFHKEKEIDLVIISGDLVDKGGQDFSNDIQDAFITFQEKIIEPLTNDIGIRYGRIFFCPGNHDIAREADDKFSELGLCKMLNCTEEVNSFISAGKETGIKRVLAFKSFEKVYNDKFPGFHTISNFQSTYIIPNIDQHKIGITCFNSCWRSYDSDNDKGNLLLGERQVIEARKIIEKCDLKIAVIHHPIDWLAEFDKKAIRNFIHKDYDLIFCGHVHEGSSWVDTSYYGGVFVSVAPTNWIHNIRNTDRISSNGFSIIDYDVLKQKIIVHHRRYNHQGESFDPNTDLGNRTGISYFDIPKSMEMSVMQEEFHLATKMEEVYFESINEHLLTYNTDTKAPKDLDHIFVHPRLLRKINPDPEKEEQETCEIQELCDTTDNMIIFGTKESGKTLLLDKILIDLTRNILRYKKLPVYYNFLEVKQKRIETIISKFLNIGIHEIDNLLRNHKIVLLVDDLSFNDADTYELAKLENFLKEYQNVQVIGTCLKTVESVIPVDFFKTPFYTNFKTVHISNFKTKEIRALIQRWFSKNELFDTPAKLDKIIEFFTTLNLPRTPLAVSMFLWIIEQQENYRPINQAVMLENFIERLFKKHSNNEIYSETFDFTNKQRLLAEIAKTMFDRDLTNYRLKYQELSNLLDESLRIKRFDFLAQNVLEHFLAKGILILEKEDSEIYVRFRFTCFFQYFLMKYMDYNEEFKEYVLHDDNFLFFTNEIDYFTGIKRDQSNILKLLVDRMNKEYYEAITSIHELNNTYDDLFATKDTIIKNLGNDFVKKLPDQKPSESELEKITDNFLESIIPDKGIKRKDREISPVHKMEILWTLTAKILKNTEETKVPNLKDDSYKSIIKASLAFAAIYKLNLEKYLNKQETVNNPIEKNLKITKDFIPLLNELSLFSLMGTKKLSAVLHDKMKKDFLEEKISDLEIFTSVFLYSDVRGKDYEKYLKDLVKKLKHPYIFDMTLFKLVTYYFFRSNDPQSDNLFENIIADLIVKAKGEKIQVGKTTFTKYTDKGNIMKQYRDKKNKTKKDDTQSLNPNE